MIYLDSSVVLAYLFAEDRCPPTALWNEALGSSRLLEYEVWNRLHIQRSAIAFGAGARALLGRVQFTELRPAVLKRALEAFPVPLRTLDAMHVSSLMYVRQSDETIRLASYDKRMLAAARALNIPLYEL